MSSKPVGMGIVGAGSIGIRGALEHLCLPDIQSAVLAAVCDPVEGRAGAAAQKYGVKKAYVEYADLLADEAVDAVVLCSPIGLHYAQGLQALQAGKHIHFNKTMTVTSEEATHLIDEAKTRNLHIVASPGQMLRPSNLRLRKMVQNGDLGQIAWAATGAAFGAYHEQESVRTGTDVLSNINPAWYWRKPGGGPMYDMTVYGLHTLTGILGPALRVAGVSGVGVKEREWNGQTFPSDADDNTLLVLDFGNALFAFVYGTFAGSPFAFGQPSFFGTKGRVEGLNLNGKPLDYPGKTDGLDPIQLLPHVTGKHRDMGEAHVFEDTMQLVDLIRLGTPTSATPQHARHVIEIIEAGYKASETGQTQSLKTTFTPPDGI